MSKPAVSQRLHIALFGRTNVGKSSLINAITNQQLAIVSDIKGTTADPVQKSIELPLGPVVIIDTAGIDDDTDLGRKRIEKTYDILSKTDIAVVVLEYGSEISNVEQNLIDEIVTKKIPYIKVYNKAEDAPEDLQEAKTIYVSAETGRNIGLLKDTLSKIGGQLKKEKILVADLVGAGDIVVLVTPIDEGAPAGRLILPQQMAIRELVGNRNIVIVVQPSELSDTLSRLKVPPALIVTDSQVFGEVGSIIPNSIPLTSFSILMARYKGSLKSAIEGVEMVKQLKSGDTVLISEGCTHHHQCDDIGRHKIPDWLNKYTGKDLNYSFTSGGEFPQDLNAYQLVVHCGGCMLNDAEVRSRVQRANSQQVKITNYGTLISLLQGTFERSVQVVK